MKEARRYPADPEFRREFEALDASIDKAAEVARRLHTLLDEEEERLSGATSTSTPEEQLGDILADQANALIDEIDGAPTPEQPEESTCGGTGLIKTRPGVLGYDLAPKAMRKGLTIRGHLSLHRGDVEGVPISVEDDYVLLDVSGIGSGKPTQRIYWAELDRFEILPGDDEPSQDPDCSTQESGGEEEVERFSPAIGWDGAESHPTMRLDPEGEWVAVEAVERIIEQRDSRLTKEQIEAKLIEIDGPLLLNLREEVGIQMMSEGWCDEEGDPVHANDPAVEQFGDRLSDSVRDFVSIALVAAFGDDR